MTEPESDDRRAFRGAVEGLLAGDFSRLDPVFAEPALLEACPIVAWLEKGWFDGEPAALDEALTCACFLGRTRIAALLLGRGLDPSAGFGTGLNALHWAANRGELQAVRLLIENRAPLEIESMYGGTALGTAVWSAIHEPRADHITIIETLIRAGGKLENVPFPSGDERIDEVLRRHGAAASARAAREGSQEQR